ncbi:hypothetical protein [Halosimplex salinum]|uniref:hypothetical protein n=1 Tax=Halosimplex salinum TaxID=1710538 RepID=UPI000F4A1D73|nr:hypothetical protein [Halosimplex salinum]
MRPLHAVPLAFSPLVPLHSGSLDHLAESVVGVVVGVVVVTLYLLALRWTGDGGARRRDSGSRDSRSNR